MPTAVPPRLSSYRSSLTFSASLRDLVMALA